MPLEPTGMPTSAPKLGLDSIEFDAEGEAVITFVPIRPGRFELRVPGTTAESQRVVFVVKG